MLQMTKTMAFLALVAAVSACVPSGANRVDTVSELEDLTGDDIDGDGETLDAGVPVPD